MGSASFVLSRVLSRAEAWRYCRGVREVDVFENGHVEAVRVGEVGGVGGGRDARRQEWQEADDKGKMAGV